MDKPQLTVGICAYNEGKNIGNLLSQIQNQKLESGSIKEVLVVSSGSSDETDSIVGSESKKDPRIKLIKEPERRGKSSAVNLISKNACGDIIVLSGADLHLEEDTLEKLIGPLSDQQIGMSGARPIPINDINTFAGYCSHLIWDLHHAISLKSPKCGELIAMRNKGYMIPDDMGADEAFLESRFRNDGYLLAYAHEAIVQNRGPQTIQDYIKQRRRIHAQHIGLAKKTGYRVGTGNSIEVAKAIVSKIKDDPGSIVFCSAAITLEAISCILGMIDHYVLKKNHAKWDIAKSTKEIR
jgi:glycosyltransferase involved in cell wall biosynthesis